MPLTKAPLRVLILSDAEEVATLLFEEARRLGYEPTYRLVSALDAIEDALETQPWDVMFAVSSDPTFPLIAAGMILHQARLRILLLAVSKHGSQGMLLSAVRVAQPRETRDAERLVFMLEYTMQRLREPLQTDWQFSAVTSSPESQHEFYRTLVELNELLSAVVTFGESLLDVQLPDKARQYAEEIFQYATRAEDVASLLLDLSPGWTVPTTVADVDTVLESMATTLRTLIGRGVELGIRLNAPSACVPVDRIQLEWLIINLVAYIRHATKLDTGRLMIESDHVEISAEHPVFSLRPGTYVRLGLAGQGGSAGDSGREFSSITSVFLSTAESIVMESGGAMQVETNAGEDRRFMILLPTTYAGEHQ